VDQGEFRAAAEKAWPVVRGRVVPAAFFDEAVRARDEARKGGAASTPAEKAAPAAKPAPGAKPATATKK
jgi:hypothetical protein